MKNRFRFLRSRSGDASSDNAGIRLGSLLDAAAADWGLRRGLVTFLVLLPVLVVLFGCVTALLGKPAYKWFVSEDGVSENLQVVAFAIASVLSLALGARLSRSGTRGLGALFVGCGLCLLWVLGEELSWGQRIAHFDTPEALAEVNRQGESNIHNVYAVELALRLAQFLVGLWATVIPFLVLRYREQLARWTTLVGVLVPHHSLALYFFGTMVWRAYRALGPAPPESMSFVVSEWSEVLELNLALGIALHLFYLVRRSGSRPLTLPGEGGRDPDRSPVHREGDKRPPASAGVA